MKTRITQLTIAPEGEPIFSEMATQITITDDATGEFLKVEQTPVRDGVGAIFIGPEDWPTLRDAIERMMATLQDENGKTITREIK